MACPGTDFPSSSESQKLWDLPISLRVHTHLTDTCPTPRDKARLLAVSERESGYWLHALPSVNFGTLLDDNSFRVAVGLRLGLDIVVPHQCRCGSQVDRLGHHGLSCPKSAGRLSRHACLNDIIRRALVSVHVPAVLEPNGLARDDGKRPDGMTLVPWRLGRPLVWDSTCVDTLAMSHVTTTCQKPGGAAANAETAKRRKYLSLGDNYIFVPFAVETLGPWGPEAHQLFSLIKKKLIRISCDPRAGAFLGQRISIAVQRGNAASILGSFPPMRDLGDAGV